MAISGHRSESVFERYDIDTDQDLRDAVEKVASYVGTLPVARVVIPMAARDDGRGVMDGGSRQEWQCASTA